MILRMVLAMILTLKMLMNEEGSSHLCIRHATLSLLGVAHLRIKT